MFRTAYKVHLWGEMWKKTPPIANLQTRIEKTEDVETILPYELNIYVINA